ncbi:hypothetical protein C826_01634 [Helicobacter bilis WiWa]|uniref:Uncharacterized protein n=1 Tax=Helicobacter bilis WiWa TaxID=1235804 RepID=N2BCJ8_9HELI|nr:hypothetical protein C826_01634 [Helicobacter bilis WiWa]
MSNNGLGYIPSTMALQRISKKDSIFNLNERM